MHSLTDTQRVRPWMLDRPIHGADGRLAHYHGLPFENQRNLLVQKTSYHAANGQLWQCSITLTIYKPEIELLITGHLKMGDTLNFS